MDDQRDTNNKPTFLSKDNNNDVLNNLDISTEPRQPNNTINSQQQFDTNQIINNTQQEYGYSSPYSIQPNNQTYNPNQFQQNTAPNQSINLSQPETFPTTPQQYQPQIQQPNIVTSNTPQPTLQPQSFEKTEPKVVYEKTVVEKGPSFLSNFFNQIFRLIGCFLFAAFVIIAIVVYIINF